MFRPPTFLWTLAFVCLVMALPLPHAPQSIADQDGKALQADDAAPEKASDDPAAAVAINEAELEARVLARLRHEVHSEVDDLALRSIEQAMRRLREREGATPERPLGKQLRLTFKLEPEMQGVAPVSVITRTSAYSAFADTFSGGSTFRLNIVGDLGLKGLRHERVVLDFSTMLQFGDADGKETGSSAVSGSVELRIGESETLMSVGARDLILTVSEVPLP